MEAVRKVESSDLLEFVTERLMVRWNDYAYPTENLRFNERLFGLFRKRYDPFAVAERGFINRSWRDRNCPYGYHFAHQRENDPNLVSASQLDDLQWRYDELNA